MMWRDSLSEYGMVFVLLLLCAVFSVLTWDEQHPVGTAAAVQVAADFAEFPRDRPVHVLIVTRDQPEDLQFAAELTRQLQSAGNFKIESVAGQPVDARASLDARLQRNEPLDAIVTTSVTAAWGVIQRLSDSFPAFQKAKLIQPRSYRWPNFLKRDNLLNITNQIAVIAMVAIGMTMVIITGGIDLSVGSLIALAAVVCTFLIRNHAGAEQATALGMCSCAAVAVIVTAIAGTISGAVTTLFKVPSFIVTLSMMQITSGMAYMLADGSSIHQVPESFVWLGRSASLLRIPNSVLLMFLLYAAAHVVMSRMAFGRYLYAVGGNTEAARLSGVPVRAVTVLAFMLCGALAGLGGVVMASQLKSGSPTYGQAYELYVIAAVVVGGTSLAGGEGKVFGTLIGALIIAVIRNGMNLLGITSYPQMVVLGLVILGAVLLDRLRRQV